MAIKRLELANPDGCLNKAAPNEPLFILRGNDPLAAQTVRLWAAMAVAVHEDAKVAEASACADYMQQWLSEKNAAAERAKQPIAGE